jgi:hypothetical protein
LITSSEDLGSPWFLCHDSDLYLDDPSLHFDDSNLYFHLDGGLDLEFRRP